MERLAWERRGRLPPPCLNGNGGWFTSMVKAGLDKDLHQKNIKWINIFAVDNVLQRIADPAFIGITCQKKAEARASDGSLEYKYGVILNYLFALDKL